MSLISISKQVKNEINKQPLIPRTDIRVGRLV